MYLIIYVSMNTMAFHKKSLTQTKKRKHQIKSNNVAHPLVSVTTNRKDT